MSVGAPCTSCKAPAGRWICRNASTWCLYGTQDDARWQGDPPRWPAKTWSRPVYVALNAAGLCSHCTVKPLKGQIGLF